MNLFVSSEWADAKRSQADWLKAWTAWTLTVQVLRQRAKYPEFEGVESQSYSRAR
jgi:hypothetical protein